MRKLSDYELQREANIERNRILLKELGVDREMEAFAIKSKPIHPRKQKQLSKKRKNDITEEEDYQPDENEQRDDVSSSSESDEATRRKRQKKAKMGSEDTQGNLRRSSRVAGKKVDYNNIEQDRSARIKLVKRTRETTSEPRMADKRTQNPKQYGHIPGVEIGTWWETREACSVDAVHAPFVAGIASGPQGAYSVALSGGYDDDVDAGYGFTYTGSGGRDLKGTKDKPKNLRTAPQSSDQTFENHFNRALQRSSETKKPIRVIRGYKLKSKYAPPEGYRYDGLYTVEKAWIEKGLNVGGFLVCKFVFKRLPGQPALPTSDDYEEVDGGDEGQTIVAESVSEATSTTVVEGVRTDIL